MHVCARVRVRRGHGDVQVVRRVHGHGAVHKE